MTTFPGSPKLLKGALVAVDPFNPLASIVVFQYNPEKMTRNIVPQAAGGGDRGEALRLKGPPEETIDLTIEIDAADQLERGDALATTVGIHPTLAALEMMLYPKTALIIANEILAVAGIIEVIPPEAPLTLLVWGLPRIVPVRLTRLSISEELFDPNLNPIRANATLALRVLSYQDLGLLSIGGALHLAHSVAKEVMATMQGVGAISGAISGSFSASGSVSIGG